MEKNNFGPQAPVLNGLKILGKINLSQFAPKKAKRVFTPFSGGATIGELLKIQGVRLQA